mgnify:CR=1 FL=1
MPKVIISQEPTVVFLKSLGFSIDAFEQKSILIEGVENIQHVLFLITGSMADFVPTKTADSFFSSYDQKYHTGYSSRDEFFLPMSTMWLCLQQQCEQLGFNYVTSLRISFSPTKYSNRYFITATGLRLKQSPST